MTDNRKRASIAVIVKGWPRLSETFIAQEILALEQAGFDLTLYSLRHPTDDRVHALHQHIGAEVVYLPEYLHDAPLRVLKGLVHACGRPGFWQAARQWFRDFRRDATRNRARRFGQACVMLRELRGTTDLLYAHFMHTPGSVGYYGSIMSGLPLAVSAHAKDIWTLEDWEKREKLAHVAFIATCTAINVDHLKSLADDPNRVHLIYHGLDASRFPVIDRKRERADGTTAFSAVQMITVARVVPKKGLELLLRALAQLPDYLKWHWRHIGGGDSNELLDLMDTLGLHERVSFHGAQDHSYVIEAYRDSDIFVLPSRIADDGDRDGLPNVLMEAMLMRLAIVATEVSAIPELIENDTLGALVPANDVDALAAALEDLIRHPDKRQKFSEAGHDRVLKSFQMQQHINRLVTLLDDAVRT